MWVTTDVPLDITQIECSLEVTFSMDLQIRNARQNEYKAIGEMMANVYSSLEGFLNPSEHPGYYEMMRNVGTLVDKPGTEIIVAMTDSQTVAGAVVFFRDMLHYGSGGIATQESNACGFRFLAVDPSMRGKGIASKLVEECILRARVKGARQVIIHTTDAMKIAWAMYEQMGFKRSLDLDFQQGKLTVYGFRFQL